MEKVNYMVHPIGKVAIEMATRWAMVAATPDGEDSSGRQKFRTMTPLELAQKAAQTAIALELELLSRGMIEMQPIPDNEEKTSQ